MPVAFFQESMAGCFFALRSARGVRWQRRPPCFQLRQPRKGFPMFQNSLNSRVICHLLRYLVSKEAGRNGMATTKITMPLPAAALRGRLNDRFESARLFATDEPDDQGRPELRWHPSCSESSFMDMSGAAVRAGRCSTVRATRSHTPLANISAECPEETMEVIGSSIDRLH